MALQRLLKAPCYHFDEALWRPDHIEAWHSRIHHGTPMDWHGLYADYAATLDFPFCLVLLGAWPGVGFSWALRERDRLLRLPTNQSWLKHEVQHQKWQNIARRPAAGAKSGHYIGERGRAEEILSDFLPFSWVWTRKYVKNGATYCSRLDLFKISSGPIGYVIGAITTSAPPLVSVHTGPSQDRYTTVTRLLHDRYTIVPL